jgi:lipoprotein NlpI
MRRSLATIAIALAVGVVACGDRETERLLALQRSCSSRYENYTEANVRGCTALLAEPSLPQPLRAMTLNIRGNTYDALRKHELAIADYTEVIRLMPDFAPAYANIGLQHCRMSDFNTALGFYDHALKVNPKSAYAMYGRGFVLGRLGQTDAAREQLASANAADPEMAKVYRQIGLLPSPERTALPNPSLRPNAYSGLRPLPPSGEFKR